MMTGAIQGPGEFVEGLALGARSLIGHTVGGVAGAASRIAGTLGKGLSYLTFDEDYQKSRRETLLRRPTDFGENLAQGGKGLFMGVIDGVSGIVLRPIEGAQRQGVGGFFTGAMKGVVGLVTRPTAAIADFASGSLDAMKKATDVNEELSRMRPPRFLHPDGIVRPYIRHQAEGDTILKVLFHFLSSSWFRITFILNGFLEDSQGRSQGFLNPSNILENVAGLYNPALRISIDDSFFYLFLLLLISLNL